MEFIVGIVFAILFAGSIIISIACSKTKRFLGIIAAIVFFASMFLIPTSIHTVDTGEVAVVKHFGEAVGIRNAGIHFDFGLTNSYETYDIKVRNLDIQTMAYSRDAQTMNIQMTVQYQIKPDKVIEITKQYGSLDILQGRIQAIATEKTKAVLSNSKAMDIIADRASMSPKVEQAIAEAVDEDFYIDITTVVITNIDFSDAFESAVEEKMIAEQKQLKAEYENQTKIAQAKADAEAKIVAAEAEAEANKLLEQSLTDTILREKYLNKWNGTLPNVVAGEDSSFLLPANYN